MGKLSLWQRLFNTTQIKNNYSERPDGLQWRSNTFVRYVPHSYAQDQEAAASANVSKFILATIGIALFTDLFLYGLLVPVLPFLLEDRIGIPDSQIQSYTSGLLAAYAGSSVLTSPIAGVIADR
jgi:hypothetical protein